MNKAKWKLTNTEYEYIKRKAIHTIVKYNIKCIPVSGFEIASKLNITMVPYSTLSKKKLRVAKAVSDDGFFIDVNGKKYIYYNDLDRSYKRQNWTILHELGHIILKHTGHNKQEEDEANFFAKYIIAPPVLVDKIGARSPKDIYNAFEVSQKEAQYAFSYYLSWIRRQKRIKRFTYYEKKLLNYFEKSA